MSWCFPLILLRIWYNLGADLFLWAAMTCGGGVGLDQITNVSSANNHGDGSFKNINSKVHVPNSVTYIN